MSVKSFICILAFAISVFNHHGYGEMAKRPNDTIYRSICISRKITAFCNTNRNFVNTTNTNRNGITVFYSISREIFRLVSAEKKE